MSSNKTHTAKNVEIEQIVWDLIPQVWFDWSLPPWPPWQGWWPHKLQTFPGPWSSLWQQTSCQCSSCHWPPAPACQDNAPGVCAEPVQSPERHSTQRQYLQHWRYKKTAFRQSKILERGAQVTFKFHRLWCKIWSYLGEHVHAHGVSCLRLEANVQVPPS